MEKTTYKHKASYNIGDRPLKPQERVVVCTRDGPKEGRRFAEHMRVSLQQPGMLLKHNVWSDGEYLPSFMTKNCLKSDEFNRYKPNYEKDGKRVYGKGLAGRTVYLIHTFSKSLSPQDLDTRICCIADTAKYNGAESVVLVAYTLDHSAQERGVWDTKHPRMQDEKSKEGFDGQAPLAETILRNYLVSGVDCILTPHNHSPDDISRIVNRLNDEFSPQNKVAKRNSYNRRYSLNFVNVDLAPMVGLYVSDHSVKNLGFDLSDYGRNVLFMAPDAGSAPFIKAVREHSGLKNSALAVMGKEKSGDGAKVEILRLVYSQGLSPKRGVGGYQIFLGDDSIRSGKTMAINLNVLMGLEYAGIIRDPKLNGTPSKIVVYATRTNFAGNSRDILATHCIDDIIITNSDPRGLINLGHLDYNTQMIWINFMLAEAAKAVERGQNPNELLTPEYIRRKRLLKIEVPHGHKLWQSKSKGHEIL